MDSLPIGEEFGNACREKECFAPVGFAEVKTDDHDDAEGADDVEIGIAHKTQYRVTSNE